MKGSVKSHVFSYFIFFLHIHGFITGKASREGGIKKCQLTAGHYTVVCSVPWTLNRNDTGVDLVMWCYKPSCFSSAKSDNRIILTFCKQTHDHDHLHLKNRNWYNVTKQGHPKPRHVLKAWALSTRLHLNEGAYVMVWFMEFNPSKCNVIRVTRRRTPFKFHYKLYGKILETVDATKYLGIYLSRDITLEWSCKWNYHQSKQDSEHSKPQFPHLFGQIQRTSIQSPCACEISLDIICGHVTHLVNFCNAFKRCFIS